MRRIILGLATMVLFLVGAGVATAAIITATPLSFTAYGPFGGQVTVTLNLVYDTTNVVGSGFLLSPWTGSILNGSYGTVTSEDATYSNLYLYPTTGPGLNNPPAKPPSLWTFGQPYDNMYYPSNNPPIEYFNIAYLMFTTDNPNVAVEIAGIPHDIFPGFATPAYYYSDTDLTYDTVNYSDGFYAFTPLVEVVPEPSFVIFLGIGIGVVSLLVLRMKA